ncbi:MAG: efflux RND transporter permease subunit [Planctomycetes bacterium]|nr:efflux RND transporter permease subunit [Planctomycetota bacterium]
MIEAIIEYSMRHRFLVLAATLLLVAAGVYCLYHTPVDAIPDLSENQVIVFTDWMGRSPKEIEDQITYPLSVNLQGLAGVKAVRSTSEFNFSMINVIFEDSIDFYFARTRVLERLSISGTFLPAGVVPYLAPDATALGQIFWYTVEGEGRDLGELRAIQDWYVRYQLNSVAGVAQVASVGGFVREYQIDVEPNKLRAYDISLGEVFSAVARANSSVGGKLFQKNGAEYLIRGVGWIRSVADLESIVVGARNGVPIYVKNLSTVQMGPEFRRSVLEKEGNEVAGGVVMMRYGENPLAVTQRVKDKIQQLQAGLPKGVRIVPFYERTRLIEDAIHTLTGTLREEILVASLAVVLILYHVRSALLICITIPLAVLFSFICMRLLGIPSNIMSLGGMAISVGVLVDASCVMVENAVHTLYRKYGKTPVTGNNFDLLIPACKLVGRPIFFSLMIMLISFLPIFALSGMEGKMFHPLAFTKSFALIGVALISITMLPALIPWIVRGRMCAEEDNWLVRSFIHIYKPVMTWLMPYPRAVLWSFFLLLGVGLNLLPRLGREFMPPLDEGSILDMPITVPRASVTQVTDDLKERDRMLLLFPEVEQVVGKAGRADTATDPSPIDMVETIVNLRPKEWWPKRTFEYADVTALAHEAVAALRARGRLTAVEGADATETLVNGAAMAGAAAVDETLRRLAAQRIAEFGPELGRKLVDGLVDRLLGHLRTKSALLVEPGVAVRAGFAGEVGPDVALRLAQLPRLEEVAATLELLLGRLEAAGCIRRTPDLLALDEGPLEAALADAGEVLGRKRRSFQERQLEALNAQRGELWTERVKTLNWELFDRAGGTVATALVDSVRAQGKLKETPAPELEAVRTELAASFAKRFFLWRKTKADLLKEMDSELQFPGWGNIWTQPIINRIDMLATGVRTMIGVKVFGDDPQKIQTVSEQIAAVLRAIPGAVDVFPDQNVGENYLEINVDRERAARYGINVGDIQDTIEVALGGKMITTTVEGRRRFPVRVRYARDYREDEEAIRRILVSGGMSVGGGGAGGMEMEKPAGKSSGAGAGVQVPLSSVAEVKVVEGPSMIKSENGMLRSYVQLNVRDRDIVGFVEEARRAVAAKVTLPAGFYIEWSGQFEHQVRARRTLSVIFPVVVLLIVLILYLTYNDVMDTVLMMLAVPGALVGGLFFQWLFGFNFSVAVWVGYIACFGMATETGVIMLVYLRDAIEQKGGLGAITSAEELTQTIIHGAVHRLRPKLLTEGTTILGLAPMLWATGTGAEIRRPMAAPVLGGILIADEVIDVTLPVMYNWWKQRQWRKLQAERAAAAQAGGDHQTTETGKEA